MRDMKIIGHLILLYTVYPLIFVLAFMIPAFGLVLMFTHPVAGFCILMGSIGLYALYEEI